MKTDSIYNRQQAIALSSLSRNHQPYWSGSYLCCSCGRWEFNTHRNQMGSDFCREFRAHVIMNEDPLLWALMVANAIEP